MDGDRENREGGIKKIERRLYSTNPISSEKKRSGFTTVPYDVSGAWDDTEDIRIMKKNKKIDAPILGTLLIVSAVFFVSAAGISIYFLMGGSNLVSTDNIDLVVSGPISVRGGEEFGLQIVVGNKNNIPLKFAELVVEYPKGSKIPGNTDAVSNRHTRTLGFISSNGVANETIKSVLFGEENSEQEVKVSLEYRVEGSNATFVKDKVFKTFISSSSISLVLDVPPDSVSGRDFILNIMATSNSSEVVKDVVLEAIYPSGFIFKEATPSPSYGDNIWVLGDLPTKGKLSVKLRGFIQGQDGEIKTVRVNAGARESKDDHKISVLFGSSAKSFVVKKPFLDLSLALNGDTFGGDYVAGGMETVRGDISWANNLPVKILNGELAVKINGEALNKSSVSAGSGLFRSADGVVIWDRTSGDFPQSIEPGQNGSQSFSFGFLPLANSRGLIDSPEVILDVTFLGTRAVSDRGDALVESTVSRKIKLASDLQLSARAVYHSGPIKNTGLLPPVVDQETTYTVLWSVSNSSNDVSDVLVKATLPSYVRWVGNISSGSEDLVYNPLGGEVVWKVGDVSVGSGIISKAREVAFQVGFTPSTSQVGSYPLLISDASISGRDLFTSTDVKGSKGSLSAQLLTDSGLLFGEDGPVRQ